MFPPGITAGPPLTFTQDEADLLIDIIEHELDELEERRSKCCRREADLLREILKYVRNEYPPQL